MSAYAYAHPANSHHIPSRAYDAPLYECRRACSPQRGYTDYSTPPRAVRTPAYDYARASPLPAEVHTSPMVINGHQLSQPARSVQWYAKYARKNVEVRYLDLFGKKEHKAADYVRKFPQGQVPTLEDNGLYIEESVAILQHMARNDSIIPRDAAQAARVNSLLAKHLTQVRKLTTEVVRHAFFAKPEEKASLISAGVEKVRPILEQYNSLLERNSYLAGRDISLADFLFVPEVDQFLNTDIVGGDVLGRYPAIRSYLRRMEGIPGYVENRETAFAFWAKVTGASSPQKTPPPAATPYAAREFSASPRSRVV